MQENDTKKGLHGAAEFLLGGAQHFFRGAQHLGEMVVEDAQQLVAGSRKRQTVMVQDGRGLNSPSEQKQSRAILFQPNGRDTISIDTSKDQMRATFLEEVFLEYSMQKSSKAKTSAMKGEYGDVMFEEFLKTSGLKCSNVRQVLKLIQLMKRNKIAEEAEEEGKGLDYTDSEEDEEEDR